MLRTCLIASLMALCVLPLSAQNPVTPDPQKPARTADVPLVRVDALVEQLGDRHFEKREAAFKELKTMGKSARKGLERHRNHKDIEIRTRVRSLLAEQAEPVTPLRRLEEIPEADNRRRPPRRNPRMELEDRLSRLKLDLGRDGKSSFTSMTSLSYDGDRLTWTRDEQGVKLVVKPGDGGDKRIFEAKDLEHFQKQHPEPYARYKKSGIFEDKVVEFNVLAPGAKDPLFDPKATRRLEERLKRMLELSGPLVRSSPFLTDGELDDEMRRDMERMQSDLDARLKDFFERTDKNGVFRELDRRRLNRSRTPRPAPRNRELLGVEVSLPPASVSLDMERSGGGEGGVYVGAVTPGSTAEKCGIRRGDVLLTVNGRVIRTIDDLVDGFQKTPAGGALRFRTWRGGRMTTLKGSKPGPVEVKPLKPLKRESKKL